ncbi:hypothetical protein FJZ19_04120 [Candidatus Pacearchaeota archaeon]|nr:hypothetical protein [Candidatus Pacearchaeota archaeon]
MELVEKLQQKEFDPPLDRKHRVRNRRVLSLETLRILASAVSEVIDEKGAQISRELDAQIEAAYNFHPYTTVIVALDRAVRENPYYAGYGIKKIQLKTLLARICPDKPTRCRGTSCNRILLYKDDEQLSQFVERNFLKPDETRDFWDYVPGR